MGINRAWDWLSLANNWLGLGPNSTTLKALTASGKILSHTIAYYYGWDGDSPSTNIPGRVILGGYDKAKVDPRGRGNDTYSLNQTPGCASGLQVRVNGIFVNLENGTKVNLLQGSVVDTRNPPSRRACIDTYEQSIGLTPGLWESFQTYTDVNQTGRVEDGFNERGFLISKDKA